MYAQKSSALTVKEVQEVLQIGANSAYSLIHSKAFPVIKIGHSYRIPTESFYRWLDGQQTVSEPPVTREEPYSAAAKY